MKSDNIKSLYRQLRELLSSKRYSQAIARLEAMAAASGSPWEIRRDIETVGADYGYLRRYAIDGVEDPDRHQQLESIVAKVRRIAQAIVRHCDIADSPRQYFATLRYEQMQPDSSLTGLLSRYATEQKEYAKNAFFADHYVNSEELKRKHAGLEDLENRIFNLLWTAFPLTLEHEETLRQAMVDPSLADETKLLLVAALSLGALEYYDERRIALLAEIYIGESSSEAMQIRALCGMLLAMWMHRGELGGRRLQSTMAAVAERRGWAEDLKMAFMEFARTRDTERISRTLTDEVIPQMMKMRSDLTNKIQLDDEQSLEALSEANPEWADFIENSGLGDKLRELNELQAGGGDVMMSSMSHLKSFPFFSDIANWFRPFSLQHSTVAAVLGNSGVELGELIDASPMMCDSDKYSIILSLERIPKANRRMMLDQFKLQDINLTEIRSSELNPELLSRRNICNKYVQDLYRFFQLYRRKSDFRNPFESPINLAAIEMLSPFFDDGDTLAAIGEFYFSRGYYNEALDTMSILLARSETVSPEILQKCGYCLQQRGDIAEALAMYSRSELLRPDSIWTIRRMAQCHKLLGHTVEALDYYKRILEVHPDDINALIGAGYCCVESGDYAQALKHYFKVEYLKPKSGKALRPIAWCAFLTGDYDRARDYYGRVMEHSPSATDYLNMGHLMMATRQYREAVNYYSLARQNMDSTDESKFRAAFEADRIYLEKAGVDGDMIDIVLDSAIV